MRYMTVSLVNWMVPDPDLAILRFFCYFAFFSIFAISF
ncbi:MAG: hypothetical protein ACI8UO_005556 [Verrucomicrobiales bacterium]|jgi:hypothetical protein